MTWSTSAAARQAGKRHYLSKAVWWMAQSTGHSEAAERAPLLASPLGARWEWKLFLALLPILTLFYVEYRLQIVSSSPPRTTPNAIGRGEHLLTAAERCREDVRRDNVRRVAVCFFGLTRSLDLTIESIKANLTDPIVGRGYEVDVFVHTYDDVDHLTNPRTGENVDVEADQWRLLEPYQVSLTSQKPFLESNEGRIQECLQQGTGWPDPWETQVSSVHNMMAALNSLFEVGKLWEENYSERNYSAVIFARPDVRFTCPFPARMLDTLEAGAVYVPDFAQWGGINDRFALLKPEDATVWKRRVFFTLQECLKTPIHAEIFAHKFAVNLGLSNFTVERFGFVRVRSDGQPARRDAKFPALCAATGP